jgi:hypothetical protein
VPDRKRSPSLVGVHVLQEKRPGGGRTFFVCRGSASSTPRQKNNGLAGRPRVQKRKTLQTIIAPGGGFDDRSVYSTVHAACLLSQSNNGGQGLRVPSLVYLMVIVMVMLMMTDRLVT